MEKQAAAPATAKSRYKLLKLLPKAATGLNFQNPPFSPGRDHKMVRADVNSANKLKTHMNKGFSAPIISIIPVEARNKSKNSSFDQAQEPTSPKVSCMGQIKHRKKLAKMKRAASLHKDVKPSSSSSPHGSKTKKSSSFLNIFSSAKPGRSKSGVSAEKSSKLTDHGAVAAPSLGQMKRFTSGRESLGNFDWTKAQIAPDDDMDHHHRKYYSDEERGDSDREEEEEEEEEVIIPFSAPIMRGGGGASSIDVEPRKEINIWKRRTMAQPRPLQLNTLY